ncbi:MAG: photosynthetic complex assembly protein PuhC [Hyphomicrobium sp.]|nr:hypothetical protein [Hyphomicrobium sp.]
MSEDAIDARPFPRGVLIAASLLVLFTMLAATTARRTDIGATRLDISNVASRRDITFTEQTGGIISAFDAQTGERIADIQSAGNGFVGVVLKGLKRERSIAGVNTELPYTLLHLEDGRSVLDDPATGKLVTLGAFGPDNLKAFTQLLNKGSANP